MSTPGTRPSLRISTDTWAILLAAALGLLRTIAW